MINKYYLLLFLLIWSLLIVEGQENPQAGIVSGNIQAI
jgi:hypothetical protein